MHPKFEAKQDATVKEKIKKYRADNKEIIKDFTCMSAAIVDLEVEPPSTQALEDLVDDIFFNLLVLKAALLHKGFIEHQTAKPTDPNEIN